MQLRLEMEEQFNDVKNNDVIWGQITKILNSHNIFVTVLQVKDKWKKFKKTYKKVVDDNSQKGNKETDGNSLKNLTMFTATELLQGQK